MIQRRVAKGTRQQGNKKTKGMYSPRSNEKVLSTVEYVSNLKIQESQLDLETCLVMVILARPDERLDQERKKKT